MRYAAQQRVGWGQVKALLLSDLHLAQYIDLSDTDISQRPLVLHRTPALRW